MKEHRGLNSILEYFEIENGKLLLGGRTAEDIAAEVGTPFYAYDLRVARKKFEMLRAALPLEVEIHYAIKANPHPQVVEFFRDLGVGFDVASAGELNIAVKVGADPLRIGFAGPAKREHEIELACDIGIGSLNVENVTELVVANRLAAKKNKALRVSLRINPSFQLVGSGMKMGGVASQFGIDQEKIPYVLRRLVEWPHLRFVGFHIFSGSQNLFVESIHSSFEKTLDTVISFLPKCPQPPVQINIGGGLGIPYYATDNELDVQALGCALKKSLDYRKENLRNIRLIIEVGRYLVGECGVYVSRILYRKESNGQIFLILDGGMHQQLAASGNLGQVIKKNFPIALPERLNEPLAENVNIVGPLCTPIDRLGTNVSLPVGQAGDLLAVFSSGAYAFTASPLGFLSHPRPTEVVIL